MLAVDQAREAEPRAVDWLEIGTPPAKIAPGESLVENRDRGEEGGVPKRAKERVLRENVASTRSVTLHGEKYGADPLGSRSYGSVGKLPWWVEVGAAARPLDGSFRRRWLLDLRSVVQLAWFSARCLRWRSTVHFEEWKPCEDESAPGVGRSVQDGKGSASCQLINRWERSFRRRDA